jgi:starch-binding outer membrane protein, SusD/RagB family
MKHINIIIYRVFVFVIILETIIGISGCKKFITVDSPINNTNADNIFKTDVDAITVLTGIFTSISADDGSFLSTGSGLPLMSLYPSLSSDELTLFSGVTNVELLGYYKNNLKSNQVLGTDSWAKIYKHIFVANSSIIGLTASTTLTPAIKQQLLGEAYFIRALCYFYLVNLYGDVPLITSIDYSVTSLQPRSDTGLIYSTIKNDLIKAENLLSNVYLGADLLHATGDRVRPNRAAAQALLARTYLYTKEWANAEAEATKIIDSSSVYALESLNNAFIKNTSETIWALQPVVNYATLNTGEALLFLLPSSGPSVYQNQVYMSSYLKNSFEMGDQRLKQWVNSLTVEGNTYYYPFKYKAGNLTTNIVEYPIVFRIAEQYLIRAEARIQLDNIVDGIEDLNIVRARATDLSANIADQLSQLSPALSKDDAMSAVLHERRVELFTEWGHRWFDLKRTNTIDTVMEDITPLKGGTWDNRWSLYPIPLMEIQNNPNLKQNPGYE